jgi:hypothetical protein
MTEAAGGAQPSCRRRPASMDTDLRAVERRCSWIPAFAGMTGRVRVVAGMAGRVRVVAGMAGRVRVVAAMTGRVRVVMPAEAGIHGHGYSSRRAAVFMDSGLRRNDGAGCGSSPE